MNKIPAILEKDLSEIKNKLDFLFKIKDEINLDFDTVQIDICDGLFVENTTWLPEKDIDVYTLFNNYKKHFSFEYHLMCEDSIYYIELLNDLNSKNFVIHIDDFLLNKKDKEYFLNIFKEIKKNNKDFILTANTKAILENNKEIISLLKEIIDLYGNIKFQVMGIDKIGVQGQKFDLVSLSVIDLLKDRFLEKIFFQIDGGINQETLKYLTEKNLTSIVVGSYLLKAKDIDNFVYNYNSLSL